MVSRFARINGIDKVVVIISRPLKQTRSLPSGKVITAEDSKLIWEQLISGSGIEKAEVHISAAASPVQVVYDYVMRDPDPNNDLVAPSGSEVYMGCGDKENDATRFDTIIQKSREDIKLKVVTCPLNEKHSDMYMSILESSTQVKDSLPSVKKGLDPRDFHASDMRYIADLASTQMIGFELFKDFVPEEDALSVLGILGINPIDSGPGEEEMPRDENIENNQLTEKLYRCIDEVLLESFQEKVAKPRMRRGMARLLDGGRHDLIKYGAPWNRPRPKTSNAFLAKESIQEPQPILNNSPEPEPEPEPESTLKEMSSMAGGAMAFGPGKIYSFPIKRKTKKKTKRKKNKRKTNKRK